MKRMLCTAGLAGLFAAALAACAPEATTPTPETPEATAPAIAAFTETADVKPFAIGDFQAAAVRDGGGAFPNDNKTLAVNVTKAEVDALLTANSLPTEELTLSIQPLIVRTTDKVLLFDAGAAATMGEFGGKLPASLAAASIDPASVTDIFISHAHGDHVGGLVLNNALAFPNAAIHIQAAEWAALKADTNMAPLVAVITPKVVEFQPGADLVPGVKAVDIKGHTPGHSGYLIGSGAQSVLFIGDMAHHYVISVQKPDWTIAFDGDAPTAQASRKDTIASAAASGQRVFAPHFPYPGLGRFEQKDQGYVWTAE